MNLDLRVLVDPDTDRILIMLRPDEDMTIRANDREPLQVPAGGFYEAKAIQTIRIVERTGTAP